MFIADLMDCYTFYKHNKHEDFSKHIFWLLISYFSYTQHYPHDHMQYDFIDEKHNELVIFNKRSE